MIALAVTLSYTGWVALCFAMPSHARKIWQRPPRKGTAVLLRVAGSTALLASLFASASIWGWPNGSLAWFGILSATGFVLIGLLAVETRLALLPVLALPAAALMAVW